MSTLAYVNGSYQNIHKASVPVLDRGFVFSDGVYEVFKVKNHKLQDPDPHWKRLNFSLGELKIKLPYSFKVLEIISKHLIKKNRVDYGMAYLQITRGPAKRNHRIPEIELEPSIVIFVTQLDKQSNNKSMLEGIKIITIEENRWARPDIKSISLLGNVLAKTKAYDMGATECWYYNQQGYITEGTSCNAYIVNDQGQIQTHPANGKILRGTTRTRIYNASKKLGIDFKEEPFTVKQAYLSKEAFVSSVTRALVPVRYIDNKKLENDLFPGKVASSLMKYFEII